MVGKQLHLSKEYVDKLLKNIPASKPEKTTMLSFFGNGIPIIESSLFPFEIHYDACDIETRQEIKIASGVWIHGAIVPKQPLEEMEMLSWDFSFDAMRKGFMERNWGMEIFKF